jgi:hypothetical protein
MCFLINIRHVGLFLQVASMLSVTNVDTLINATEKEGIQLTAPVESIIEKVSFLFNNLNQSNLKRKVNLTTFM